MRALKFARFLNILAIGVVAVVFGCTLPQGNAPSDITKLDFSLPQQIQWKQTKNQAEKGNTLAEWIPKNSELSNTPVRVVYQRLKPAKSTATFLADSIKPLRAVCADIKVTPFKTSSQYTDQSSAAILCARLGKKRFGVTMYLSVFSDKVANHLVISEVKVPLSKKAGVVDSRNAKEKRQAQNSRALAARMYQFNDAIRVCGKNAKDSCF